MKQIVLIAIAFVTLQTTAQDKRKLRSEDHRAMMKDLSPEERATIKTKRLTLDLDLNQEQQTQIKDLILKEVTEKQTRMESRQKESKNDDKEMTKEAYVERINAKLDKQIEMKAKMKAILTTEQFEKWDAMPKHKPKKRKHKQNRKER